MAEVLGESGLLEVTLRLVLLENGLHLLRLASLLARFIKVLASFLGVISVRF